MPDEPDYKYADVATELLDAMVQAAREGDGDKARAFGEALVSVIRAARLEEGLDC